MEIDPQNPKRLRRLARIWAGHSRYFLTCCTRDRQVVLAHAGVHERIRSFAARSLEDYGVWVDAYVAMPDHLHLIVSMARESVSLGEWVKAFKAVVAHREFRWQPGYFDHVLRSDESAGEKWEYIRMNPVRAGLVARPDQWPYSGFFDPRTGHST